MRTLLRNRERSEAGVVEYDILSLRSRSLSDAEEHGRRGRGRDWLRSYVNGHRYVLIVGRQGRAGCGNASGVIAIGSSGRSQRGHGIGVIEQKTTCSRTADGESWSAAWIGY